LNSWSNTQVKVCALFYLLATCVSGNVSIDIRKCFRNGLFFSNLSNVFDEFSELFKTGSNSFSVLTINELEMTKT